MPAAPQTASGAALNDRALALFELGNAEEADAAWHAALALDPEHFEATLLVGRAAFEPLLHFEVRFFDRRHDAR
jgi:tetratricopeptide (TPR) repeat protein